MEEFGIVVHDQINGLDELERKLNIVSSNQAGTVDGIVLSCLPQYIVSQAHCHCQPM